MQRNIDLFVAPGVNLALRITTEKTVVIHQPPPSTTYNTAHIYINGAQLNSVNTLTYPGSNLSHSTKIDDEVAKASQAC
ncbi:unnamed protein product [Schistocephalus solidus]|uniref:Uncharacterized protein n=1 Tax=Schistocephalus solidus TaxID=70667 RepID=A0A183SEF1_SCHSO|nr:unnamed protein product [Schistocephalus solidus]